MATEAPTATPAEATGNAGETGGTAFTGGSAPLRPTGTSPGAFIGASMGGRKHARFLNALFYARHGAGKSTLAGTAVDVEEMQDVLVITAEGGEIVFEGNPRINNWELIDTIKIDRIEQFEKVYQWLKNHVAFRDKGTPEAEANLRKLQDMAFPPENIPDPERLRRYRTVIVDSYTEIEGMNLTKILGQENVGMDAGEEFGVAGYAEFRKNMHLMMKSVRQLRDLDINFLAICAEAWMQDERKAYHYSPKMTGQLRDVIQGFFDVVGWLVPMQTQADATGKAPRRLYVQPQTSPKADAKCRLATFTGQFFEDPTMETVMAQTRFIKRGKTV